MALADVLPEARQVVPGEPAARRREEAQVESSGTRGAVPAPERAIAEERPQPWGSRAEEAAGEVGRTGGHPPETRRFSAPAAQEGKLPGAAVVAPSGEAGPVLAAGEFAARVARVVDAPQEAVPAGSREVTLAAGEVERELPGLLVREARLVQGGREQELRVRVRPPELGEIRVTFRARDGELTGTVLAERETVRGWLAAEAPAWREQLAASGVRVGSIDVGLMAHDGADGHAQPWHDGAARGGSGGLPGHPVPAGDGSPAIPGELSLGVNAATAAGSIDYLA